MRYQTPRSAYNSEEKKRGEEGQNYSKRPLPPPAVRRALIETEETSVVGKDGRIYTYDYSNAPRVIKDKNPRKA
jgi:hypothetical protein